MPSRKKSPKNVDESPSNALYNKLIFALILSVIGVLVIIVVSIAWPKTDTTPVAPDTMQIELAGKPFTLELALNDADRQQGLMHRESLTEDGGMLFIFEDNRQRVFHMKNCLIPLDIIFIEPSGKIIQITTLPPPSDGNEIPHTQSLGPAQYVIELNGGRDKAIGLVEGDTVQINTGGIEQFIQ